MANTRHARRNVSTIVAFLTLAGTKAKQSFAVFSLLLAALTCIAFAQDQSDQAQASSPVSPTNSQASVTPVSSTVTVPAGTRIALVLTHPILSRSIRRGDDIYAQIASPVISGDQAVIPPGTFVQGKVDKLERQGGRGDLHLQSMSITFPDGYVAPISGPVTLESSEGYALNDPGKGRFIGGLALPAAGAGLGALIGHSVASSQNGVLTNTLPPGCTGPPPGCLTSSVSVPPNKGESTVIGAAVGGAIGMVASLVILTGSHHFFLDVGSPVEMVLQQPLSLQQNEVTAAIHESEEHPLPPQPVARRPQPPPPPDNNDPGICYTPGNPGTPDMDIPGTPAIGDSPGTPPIHIAGIPPTPPVAHPCP
jgi:hypothetical protein